MSQSNHYDSFENEIEDEVHWLPVILAKATLKTWLGFFIGALVITTSVNALFGIELPKIVDVLFAAQLTYIGLTIILLLFSGIYMAWPPSWWGAVGVIVYLIIAYFLMPFAGLAAYWLYAKIFGLALSGHSFVYDGFLADFRSAIHAVANTAKSEFPKINWKWIESQNAQTWAPIGVSLLSAIIGHYFPQRVFVTNGNSQG